MSEDTNKTTPSPQRPKAASRLMVGRRQFMAGAGMAVGAAALGVPRARAQSRTEITFASAKFFGKQTVGDVVEMYNQAQSKVHVTYVELPPPSASTEVHQALVQQLARKSGTPDVFTQDVVWIAEFAGAGWALPLDEYFNAEARAAYFPGTVAACTYDGKLTALPWFVDSGMLYYRKDLLETAGAKPPTTWDELVATAKALQEGGKAKFGYLWQGKQAEVLVCDAVEVIASNGGSILSADGKSGTLADAKAVEAIQFLHDTINTHKISPSDVLSWDEEPSRAPFTGGEAAFLRNWSYVYSIAQDPKASQVVDKVGVVPLPHFAGGSSAACLGGYQYGVNAATKNREAAIDFLTWMSSPEIQLHFALQLGIAPTRPAVFDDQKLGAEQPFMKQLKPVFTGATPRPVTPKYAQVTLAIQSGVSRALATGNVKAELEAANQKISSVVGG
ncbi:ABC transporter substrate-binding protein [Prosthecomicrobium pneumaticum]|uniref:Multiple sugar transport system substrate-binding protein n=1 Tax=Prosthecomicrobium pneumaticum TaxID=81895 RepID=A0A7W9CTE7_9HYPH|nr:ABC transporter substrate-binding protein [Prosthecomicrobium pneumaticum]MBB5751583.1 multiple sugar transport system substrate-binding protein [Prosthecomicrobium pneumaticum]